MPVSRSAHDQPRVALVTGANRGIGLEIVRQLAERGYRVLLGSRTPAHGETAARALAGAGEITAVELDVASPALEDQALAAASVYGGVDVLVNNAGIHYDTDQTTSTASFTVVREALDTNLLGAWRTAAVLLPGMRDRRWGRVVNVSSEAGGFHSIGASTPAYSISKAALNALTIALAAEYRGTGVLVNAICPGWVATDMGGAGGRPVADGARSVLYGVELPDDGPTGGFFRDGQRLRW
jgi:NAD(P)-dependent dehydrogenase (short-subunit alcohol dehydrogenase family)